jgi:hypothetical protein
MSSLSGKTVVIIAGSRGLGLETARQARGSSADRSLDGDHRVGRVYGRGWGSRSRPWPTLVHQWW